MAKMDGPAKPEFGITFREVPDAWDWNGIQYPLSWFQGEEFPDAKALGAFRGDTKVATIVYEVIAGEMIWIDHVWVAPEYRKRGLFKAMARWIREQNPNLPFEADVKHPAVEKVMYAGNKC